VLYRALRSAGVTATAVTPAQLIKNMHDQLATWKGYGSGNPFGELRGFEDAPTPYAFGYVALEYLYRKLTGGTTFRTAALRQLDYVFGSNPWNVSFVIGAGSNWVRCPHHQLANLRGSTTGTGNILRGAVVRGAGDTAPVLDVQSGMVACSRSFSAYNLPKKAYFMDRMTNYNDTEPEIDWVAMAQFALASQTR
jgi:endoglucanase